MAESSFVELVTRLLEAMGQRMDAARPIPEGLLLKTGDRFLYAFLQDPSIVSLETVRRLFAETGDAPSRLVVLSIGRLPLALAAEVSEKGATLVEGQRFAELVRQLGLESYLGEEPRPAPALKTRLLPSAQQLDQIMGRARTWLDWGVPALALRFYRQAATLKPAFLPARNGIGRSLTGLGLFKDADRTFDEVLMLHPGDLEARLGKASVLGASGRSREEVDVYRGLLAEDARRLDVRAHLVAALIALNQWENARVELETMLSRTPEDPQLRYLHAVTLEKTGHGAEGAAEREEARRLGLSYEREASLSGHLGIPPPSPPVAVAPVVVPRSPRYVRPVVTERVAPARRRARKPKLSAPSRSRPKTRPSRKAK